MRAWKRQARCGYWKAKRIRGRRRRVQTDTFRHHGVGKVRIVSPGQMAELVERTLADTSRDHAGLQGYWCEKCGAAHLGHAS